MKTSKQNQVGNFEKLVSFTNAQGAVYNPGKASIKSAALQTLLTQTQGAIQAAYVSRTAYVNAVNSRNQAIKAVPKMATRIIGTLEGLGVSEEMLNNCRAIKRRFHRSTVKAERMPKSAAIAGQDQEPGIIHRSASYGDVASMVANFQQLVTLATSDPLYKPNEPELQIAGLNTFIATLQDKNKAVNTAKIALNMANRKVDDLLYGASGIYQQASAAKGYIKALHGYGSDEHKEICSLKFRKTA